MGKVTFEFDTLEEPNELELIVSRHRLVKALYNLEDFKRSIYKGYATERRIIKPNGEEMTYTEMNDCNTDFTDCRYYLDEEKVIDKLNDIISMVADIIF